MNPVFPSILSTDFFNLEQKLQDFQTHGIDYIHLDIMDGHFVPNLSFGPSAGKAIKSKFDFKIDAHLMVSNPGDTIPRFIDAGADWVSFHLETRHDENVDENIAKIKDRGCRAGLVLNPDTPVDTVFPYIKHLDYILLMSVFPGYGGQKFIEATVERTARLKEEIKKAGSQCLVQVDGGINTSNIPALKQAGADLFVIGTFLFNSEHIENTLKSILNKINN